MKALSTSKEYLFQSREDFLFSSMKVLKEGGSRVWGVVFRESSNNYVRKRKKKKNYVRCRIYIEKLNKYIKSI